MKIHPNQLEIDFTVPAETSLTVRQISKTMGISTSKIYEAIDRGELVGTTIGHTEAEREEWRIPLHNYLAWVGNEYPERLLYKWPKKEWLPVKRVAQFLSCSQQHIHNHIRNGAFPHAEDIGAGKLKIWRVPLRDLMAFVQRRSNATTC